MQTLSSRWLVAIAAVVVALILVSVVVALINPRGAAETLPEDTPEGIVQRFILALEDEDYSLAHGYLSDELKESCPMAHMRDTVQWFAEESRDRRVALLEKEDLSDGRVQIRVRITEVTVSPPFGVNEYSHKEFYVLVREGGEWRFAELPWPIDWCPTTVPERQD